MILEVAANGNERIDSGLPGESYVTRDGHGYFLKEEAGGIVVMRVEDVGTVLAEQMKKLAPHFREEMQQHAPTPNLIEKGTMTINGRTGAAFFMQAANGSLSPVPWAVMSSDASLAPLGRAMARKFEGSLATLSATTGTAPFANMLAVLKKGAPILFAGAELQSVDFNSIPISHFELPAKPETLDRIRQLLGAPATPQQ